MLANPARIGREDTDGWGQKNNLLMDRVTLPRDGYLAQQAILFAGHILPERNFSKYDVHKTFR